MNNPKELLATIIPLVCRLDHLLKTDKPRQNRVARAYEWLIRLESTLENE